MKKARRLQALRSLGLSRQRMRCVDSLCALEAPARVGGNAQAETRVSGGIQRALVCSGVKTVVITFPLRAKLKISELLWSYFSQRW